MLYKRKQKQEWRKGDESKKYKIAKTTKNYKKSISVKKKTNKRVKPRHQQTKHEKKQAFGKENKIVNFTSFHSLSVAASVFSARGIFGKMLGVMYKQEFQSFYRYWTGTLEEVDRMAVAPKRRMGTMQNARSKRGRKIINATLFNQQ